MTQQSEGVPGIDFNSLILQFVEPYIFFLFFKYFMSIPLLY